MIKLEKYEVMNVENAMRGMRNPLNSWEKSDSFLCHSSKCEVCKFKEVDCYCSEIAEYEYIIGKNDLKLAKRLIKAGTDHRKFMRQIFVSVDITAPLYFWKEYDTYKVGTTANSCSTMHKIHSKPFEMSDFSIEKSTPEVRTLFEAYIIPNLECHRKVFNATKEKIHWYSMIQLLPSSYNQMRTCTLTYENLRNMYFARCNHKLDEWKELCIWIEKLPYSELITGGKENE